MLFAIDAVRLNVYKTHRHVPSVVMVVMLYTSCLMYLLYTITAYDYYNITIVHTYCHLLMINNRLSVTSYYDCILAMLFGLSMNGRLEVTPFSIPKTAGIASVNRRDMKQNVRADSTRQP